MQNDSLNFFASFDSLPYTSKQGQIFSNEMKLIVSKIEIGSFKSIDENLEANLHEADEIDEPSIGQFHDDNRQYEMKNAVIGTNDNIKTPKKKKKGGCVCKKTGCLKLYCQCFSSGKICTQQCICCDCSNTSGNNEEVVSVRIIRKNRCKHQAQKKVCNCKKSQCMKKYCQCYNAGVACSAQCKCDGCCNRQQQHNRDLV